MTSTPTKQLKTEIKAALKAGFAERGWRPQRGNTSTYIAPESVVGPPLALDWALDLDSDTYGGARFSGGVHLRSPEVTEIVVGFGPESWPVAFTNFPGDESARLLLALDLETAGGLVDPSGDYHKWLVTEAAELPSAISDFFTMVDGPLAAWAAPRSTTAAVLDAAASSGERPDSVAVRTLPTLALLQDRPEVARAVIGRYEPAEDDSPESVARFETLLSHHFPAYGPLQRG